MPCVFFIGVNGIPLEVTGGYLPPDELIQKLNKALQVFNDFLYELHVFNNFCFMENQQHHFNYSVASLHLVNNH